MTELNYFFSLTDDNRIDSPEIWNMQGNYPFKIDVGEFKGKRVLVTGGTKAMGRSIVQRFALSDALVATTARSPVPSDFAGARRAEDSVRLRRALCISKNGTG